MHAISMVCAPASSTYSQPGLAYKLLNIVPATQCLPFMSFMRMRCTAMHGRRALTGPYIAGARGVEYWARHWRAAAAAKRAAAALPH